MSGGADAWVGSTFGAKYVVEAHLGAGAMGNVFRVRHVKFARQFALKLLHPELLTDTIVCKRFAREAELAGRLRHHNCIAVVDVGTHEGTSFIVMELADGAALSAMLGDGPLPRARAFALLRQLCDGLEHAHSRGVIHRDLKPDNVIVEHDAVRIVDFGIARLREGDPSETERLTRAGYVLGTPQYMAPELARGKDYDHRIDLFAVGVISFEMFAGHLPFPGSGVDVAVANMTQPTPAMPDVDPLLEAFTHKLMAKDPDVRPASARAARELLDLIDRDRDAAARALGLATMVPEPIVNEPATAPAPAVCARPGHHAAVRAHRWREIGAAASVAFVALVATLGIVSASRHVDDDAPQIDVALSSDVEPSTRASTARIERPIASRRHRVMTLARPHVAERVQRPAPVAVLPAPVAVRPAPVAVLQVEAPVTVQPPVVAPATSADAIARHYMAVGRELKTLKDAGMDTSQLWQSYRRIRIQDAMGNSALREQAVAVLTALDRQLAQLR